MSDSLKDANESPASGAASSRKSFRYRRLIDWFTARRHVVMNRVRLRFLVSLQQSASYARANMVYFAALEIAGQPLYYYIWHDVYPQAYESVWLRATCVVISLPMLFEPKVSRQGRLDRWVTVYWLFSMLFQLPFFFSYMTLMNDLSPVWALSSMASLMLLVILVFDWLMTILLTVAGGLLAWAAFMIVNGQLQVGEGIPLPVLLSIYFFGIVVGSVLNYKSELIAREKLAAITDAMGTIAHELRTPLLGIRSGAKGLSTYLPAIMDGYELARAHNLAVTPVRQAHFRQMQSVLERIHTESEYTGVVLDMLLVNANRASIDQSAFASVSIAACVRNALERYPFHSARERGWVHWEDSPDFQFRGSELLMVHVLFNLLKNAIYHLARADKGQISIWTTRHASGVNKLHFRDTGPGIPPDILPRIFERFYSGMPTGQGTGIGLAFVRRVIDSFGGYIRCHSNLGEYTEFTMTFPELDHDEHA